MTVGTFFSIVTWVVVGGIAGYVASVLLRAERAGCLVNIVLGVAGAFVGGFLMHNFIMPQGIVDNGFIDSIIDAILGAVVILIALELILPGRQLGVRNRGEGGGGSRRRRRRGGGIDSFLE